MGYSPLDSKDSDKTQGLSRAQHSTAKQFIYHVLHLFFSFNHISWRSLHINAQRASLAFFFVYNTAEEYAPVWVCYSLFNQHLLMTIYFVSKHFISDNVAEDNLALYVISEVCSLIPRSWIADRVLQNLQNKFFIFYFFWQAEFLLLPGLFSSCDKQVILSSCGVQTSYCSGFSCCWECGLGCTGFSSCGTWVQ